MKAVEWGQSGQRQLDQPNLTPLYISYEKLLLMICELSDFRWPEPLKTDPTKRDRNKKCAYHKEQGHTMKQCRSLHYLVEKLVKVGHLKQYVRLSGKGGETSLNPATTVLTTSITPRAVINYIHAEPLDEEYNSK